MGTKWGKLLGRHQTLTRTYVYTAKNIGNRPMLFAHPLCGKPASSQCRPLLADEQPDDGEPWRTSYRLNEPEKLKLTLGTLRKVWEHKRNQNLGDLAVRRRTWEEKCECFARYEQRRKTLSSGQQEHLAEQRRKANAAIGSSSDSG